MPGIGVLLYSAWMWHFTGNPLQWAAGHAAWGREYVGFGPLIADRYDWLVNAGLYTYSTYVPTDMLNTMGAVFGLVEFGERFTGDTGQHARQGFEQGEVFLDRHRQLGAAQGVEEVDQHDSSMFLASSAYLSSACSSNNDSN